MGISMGRWGVAGDTCIRCKSMSEQNVSHFENAYLSCLPLLIALPCM